MSDIDPRCEEPLRRFGTCRAWNCGCAWGGLAAAAPIALADAFRPGFVPWNEAEGWLAAGLVIAAAALVGGAVGTLARWGLPGVPFALPPRWVWLALALTPVAGRPFAPDLAPGALETPWRVIVLGLDGATWDVIDRLREGGELPNFDRLAREGAVGILRSEEPTLSPRVWTTIATGVDPEVHGAQDFYSQQASIRVPRIWDVVESAGGRIGLWGWLLTWPPRCVQLFGTWGRAGEQRCGKSPWASRRRGA